MSRPTTPLIIVPALLLAAALIGAGPSLAGGPGLDGVWKASCLGSAIEATVRQEGDALSGVCHVTGPLGQRDTYHFSGWAVQNEVLAWHHNGRLFRGRLQPNGHLSGVLYTATGQDLALEAVRQP